MKTLKWFLGLFTGKTLREIKNSQKNIEQQLENVSNTQKQLTQLRDCDYNVVLKAVSELLSGNIDTLPKLKQFVTENGAAHKNTPLVIASLQANVPVWMFGDAGSGKTTTAYRVAELLGLPFRFISVCPTTTKSELFGYMDANGTYHRTAFREIFQEGGVFLIDEIDNGNPSILSVMNMALANGYCAFPDGNIKRHENARFIAAANTIGHGADVKYVGRNAIDATTLDRFVFVRMDIDENLEQALVDGTYNHKCSTNIAEGGLMTVKKWHEFVCSVRKACHELGIEFLVTPRATLYGKQLISVGVGEKNLKEMCIWKGMRETDRTKILEFIERSGG